MFKFKVGDRIRRIKIDGNAGLNVGDEAEVVKVMSGGRYLKGWPCTMYNGQAIPHNPQFVELVPTGFEVGKTYEYCGPYKNRKTIIYSIEAALSNGSYAFTTNEGKAGTLRLSDYSIYKEYIPPSPEEWRAVFFVENGKPEIGAVPYKSKSECEADYTNASVFMYAIRTDEGVLKNG